MGSKSLLISLFALATLTSNAQEWQDVTSKYLANPSFDSNYDYAASAGSDVVADDIKEVTGWTKHTQTTKGVTGVYQFGTDKTVIGTALPTTGADGTTNGGMLVLRPNTKTPTSYCAPITEENKMPAGDYKIEIAMWHLGNTELRIQNRWMNSTPIPEDAPEGFSRPDVYDSHNGSKYNMEADKWNIENIEFTLDEPSTGYIYLTVAGPSALKAAASGIAVDYIKVYYKESTSGVKEINASSKSDKTYNILGQPVGKNAKGLLIEGGKKFFRK